MNCVNSCVTKAALAAGMLCMMGFLEYEEENVHVPGTGGRRVIIRAYYVSRICPVCRFFYLLSLQISPTISSTWTRAVTETVLCSGIKYDITLVPASKEI